MSSQDGDPSDRSILSWLKNRLGVTEGKSPTAPTTPENTGAAPTGSKRTQTAPAPQGDRTATLRFVRETPLVYGRWREFKALYKQAETAGDLELLGALLGRLDAAPFPERDLVYTPRAIAALKQIKDVALDGAYAYVITNSPSALHILDLTDPIVPVEIGKLSIPNAVGVRVSGSWAYVISEGNYSEKGGLHLVDVSRPEAPYLMHSQTIPYPTHLALAGHHALVLSRRYYSEATLHVVDVANPAKPRQVAEQKVGSAVHLAAEDRTALIVTHTNYSARNAHLVRFDLSDPAHPRRAASLNLDYLKAVSIAGNHAYAVTQQSTGTPERPGELHVIDLAKPEKLTKIAVLPVGNGAALSTSGTRAYVATHYGAPHLKPLHRAGLRLVDITDPKNPRLLAFVPQHEISLVASHGTRALYGGYQWRNNLAILRCLDAADPERPFVVGQSPSRATLGYMKRRGRRLLRGLAKTDPHRFVELAFHTLSAAGHKQDAVDPRHQWVSMDLLFGGSNRYVQGGHDRGVYTLKNPRFVRKTREERATAAWEQRPLFARTLLNEAALPWQTYETAFKILGAAPSELASLSEKTLACFLIGQSPLLIALATREVAARLEVGKILKGDTVADAYFLGNRTTRQRLEPVLNRTNLPEKWLDTFSTGLANRVYAGVVPDRISRRQIAGIRLLLRAFPKTVAQQPPPDLIVALLTSNRADLIAWALAIVRQVSAGSLLLWLNLLNALPEATRAPAVATLREGLASQAMTFLQAYELVTNPTPWVRETGWTLLAASVTETETVSKLWRRVIGFNNELLVTALQSSAALSLLLRDGETLQQLLETLQAQPDLARFLSPEAFAAVLGSVTPAGALAFVAATPDDAWAERRGLFLNGLRHSGQLTAFWKAAWAAISVESGAVLARRLLDDPEIAETFLALTETEFLTTTSNPVFGPLLARWVRARTELFGPGSPPLLAVATHPLPELREWGLERVRRMGMELPFALRLLEAELPACVAAGKEFFEAVSGADSRALEMATALCDSPKSSVRAYGRAYVEARWTDLPTTALFARLSENPDPQTQAYVAAKALSGTPETTPTPEFDNAVLRARNRGREAKELVKKRLAKEAAPATNIPLLLEMARSRTPRDAEWALQQLVRLARDGHTIEGLSLEVLPEN